MPQTMRIEEFSTYEDGPTKVHCQLFFTLHYVGLIVVILYFNRTFIFVWYMTSFIIKYGHQKDTCYDEIGLCPQIMSTLVGSTTN